MIGMSHNLGTCTEGIGKRRIKNTDLVRGEGRNLGCGWGCEVAVWGGADATTKAAAAVVGERRGSTSWSSCLV